MEIYYLLLEASPTLDHEEYNEIGGAFINCWAKASNPEHAKNIVVETLSKYYWNVSKIDENFMVNEEFYKDNPESLECFKQACREGEYYIFNEWPNEPQEDETIH